LRGGELLHGSVTVRATIDSTGVIKSISGNSGVGTTGTTRPAFEWLRSSEGLYRGAVTFIAAVNSIGGVIGTGNGGIGTTGTTLKAGKTISICARFVQAAVTVPAAIQRRKYRFRRRCRRRIATAGATLVTGQGIGFGSKLLGCSVGAVVPAVYNLGSVNECGVGTTGAPAGRAVEYFRRGITRQGAIHRCAI
jgi:hypothetical protein